MKFSLVTNSIHCPHFIDERDGKIVLLNFCHGENRLLRRILEYSPIESKLLTRNNSAQPNQALPTSNVKDGSKINLSESVQTRRSLGAFSGKVYYFDPVYSSSKKMTIWRIDCATGINEFSKIPQGYLTRFADSEFILHEANGETIYKFKKGEDAEMVKKIRIPSNAIDFQRYPYGSKVLCVGFKGSKIRISALDVISEQVIEKTIKVVHKTKVIDPKTRFFCARDNLMAVINAHIIFVNIRTLDHTITKANLDPNSKYFIFAIDSNDFLYCSCKSKNGEVKRAKCTNLTVTGATSVVLEEFSRSHNQAKSSASVERAREPSIQDNSSESVERASESLNKAKSTESYEDKLLREMKWLREYIERPREGDSPQTELENLQKRYARLLLMMGRSTLKN